MSFNQLGYINFANLDQYLIQARDLLLGQTLLQAFNSELLNDIFSQGVVYGGALTVSGLNATIGAGFVVFPNGTYATFPAQTVGINPGDGSHWRVDRLVLSYLESNDLTVTNQAGLSQTLDKFQGVVLSVVQGANFGTNTAVPGSTPANNISVGLIPVVPTDVNINSATTSQLEDSALTIAANKFGGVANLIRFNRTKNLIEISNDSGTHWGPINQGAVTPSSVAIPNGGSVPLNTGIILDPSRGHSANIPASIYRTYTSGTVKEIAQVGRLVCHYKPVAAAWTVALIGEEGDDSGLEFGMNGNQITLTEIDSYTGTGYSGSLTWGAGSYV